MPVTLVITILFQAPLIIKFRFKHQGSVHSGPEPNTLLSACHSSHCPVVTCNNTPAANSTCVWYAGHDILILQPVFTDHPLTFAYTFKRWNLICQV